MACRSAQQLPPQGHRRLRRVTGASPQGERPPHRGCGAGHAMPAIYLSDGRYHHPGDHLKGYQKASPTASTPQRGARWAAARRTPTEVELSTHLPRNRSPATTHRDLRRNPRPEFQSSVGSRRAANPHLSHGTKHARTALWGTRRKSPRLLPTGSRVPGENQTRPVDDRQAGPGHYPEPADVRHDRRIRPRPVPRR